MSVPEPVMSLPSDPLEPIGAALFRPLGVDGVYARTALYEDIVERLAAFITRQRDPRAEVLRFPPVMSRSQLEKSGYLKSFPNLLGCVCALHGSEREIRAAADSHETGGDWTKSVSASDLVLSPAACYPVYPLAAARGPLPAAGLIFDVAADCFRHEPSRALNRLQSFRMREYVRIGAPQDITVFRDQWMERASKLADELALPTTLDVANDPFFGRVGQVMAVSQRQQSLKFELLIPYYPGATPTACMSFNCHREHFGEVWGIRDDSGAPAHTGCVAFGMDRLAVALFCIHGLDVARWPATVRRSLRF
ncbi:MAG TPA: amino acid--[acyl-carrier-protein] ligase [Steroidobacteraceae bacterium]|nr:amino acid--[acyl-carrier-protein] ligase [Steroidobacteraceae bacterium]